MNKTLYKLHSWLALTAVIPLLIISLTGALLVFKFELDNWLMPDRVTLDSFEIEPSSPLPTRLNTDELFAQIQQAYPEFRLASWEVFDDHVEADRLYLVKLGTDHWYKTYLDPYRGELLAEPVLLHSEFTEWLIELHYTFLFEDIPGLTELQGVVISLIVAVLLLLLGLSGLMMYRKFWQKLFQLRWHAAWVTLYTDLHRLAGTLASPILLIVGFTGGYFNVVVLLHEFDEEHINEPLVTQIPYQNTMPIQQSLTDSQQRIDGFTPTYIRLPDYNHEPLRLFGWVPTGNPLISNYASSVDYHHTNGEFQSYYDIREQSTGAVILDSFRRLHFGNFGGLLVQILWALLAGILPLLLAITGLSVWWRRKSKRRKSKQRRQSRQVRSNSQHST